VKGCDGDSGSEGSEGSYSESWGEGEAKASSDNTSNRLGEVSTQVGKTVGIDGEQGVEFRILRLFLFRAKTAAKTSSGEESSESGFGCEVGRVDM
jgi:hypothetical protein